MISNFDFIYITNIPRIGEFITTHGVKWVMVDLEHKGKSERQKGRNTVISAHSISDVKRMRSSLRGDNLLVRVNPIGQFSRQEIDAVIDAGADAVMLPFFKKAYEVENFVKIVASRCKIFLLLETLEGIQNLSDILNVDGIYYVHIGLNDLHIERNTKFMFEFVADGSIDPVASLLSARNVKFGIGGVGRYGQLLPPAECVLSDHIRLHSSGVILSRSFMNADTLTSVDKFCAQFELELNKLRKHLDYVECKPPAYFEENRKQFMSNVAQVVANIQEN